MTEFGSSVVTSNQSNVAANHNAGTGIKIQHQSLPNTENLSCMPYPVNSANGHCEVPFQSRIIEVDDANISQYLDSVLINSGEDLYCEDLVTQKNSSTESETVKNMCAVQGDGLFYLADEGMAKTQVSQSYQVLIVLCCDIVLNF